MCQLHWVGKKIKHCVNIFGILRRWSGIVWESVISNYVFTHRYSTCFRVTTVYTVVEYLIRSIGFDLVYIFPILPDYWRDLHYKRAFEQNWTEPGNLWGQLWERLMMIFVDIFNASKRYYSAIYFILMKSHNFKK